MPSTWCRVLSKTKRDTRTHGIFPSFNNELRIAGGAGIAGNSDTKNVSTCHTHYTTIRAVDHDSMVMTTTTAHCSHATTATLEKKNPTKTRWKKISPTIAPPKTHGSVPATHKRPWLVQTYNQLNALSLGKTIGKRMLACHRTTAAVKRPSRVPPIDTLPMYRGGFLRTHISAVGAAFVGHASKELPQQPRRQPGTTGLIR